MIFKRGFTLYEIVLTLTLVSMCFMGLSSMISLQRRYATIVHNNTSAIFLLESIKSIVLQKKDAGESLESIIDSSLRLINSPQNWQIKLEPCLDDSEIVLVITVIPERSVRPYYATVRKK